MTKVCMATRDFYGSFARFIPNLEVIQKPDDVAKYDLVIFSGGEDIDPRIYRAKNTASYGVNRRRDDFEIQTVINAMNMNKKLFGVCRGHQLLCALFGCTLSQDLLTDGVPHYGDHELDVVNRHDILKFFRKNVNSLHHQGVYSLNPSSFSSIARHKNIHEIVLSRDNSILAVQFHPEFMDDTEKFFKWLVEEWALTSRSMSNNINRFFMDGRKSEPNESQPMFPHGLEARLLGQRLPDVPEFLRANPPADGQLVEAVNGRVGEQVVRVQRENFRVFWNEAAHHEALQQFDPEPEPEQEPDEENEQF